MIISWTQQHCPGLPCPCQHTVLSQPLRKETAPSAHHHDRPNTPCADIDVFAAATLNMQTIVVMDIIVKAPVELINTIARSKCGWVTRHKRTSTRQMHYASSKEQLTPFVSIASACQFGEDSEKSWLFVCNHSCIHEVAAACPHPTNSSTSGRC